MTEQKSQGIHFFTKLGIVCSIMAFTLIYSIYQKRSIQKLTSSLGPILQKLPSFQLKEFQEDAVISSDNLFQGGNKLAMVHFWGTWCAPCEVELPSFIELAKKFDSKKVKVLLLAVNDDEEKMKKHLRRFGKLPKNILLAHDPKGKLLPLFGTVKVPETYLFNSRGKTLNKFTGPQDWSQASYFDRVNFYLNAQESYRIESH